MDAQTGEARLILQTAPALWNFRGAAVSPDGKAIFYLHRDTNNSSIHVHEIETGRDREIYRMVSPLNLGYLALSPDGRQVAFLVADYATWSVPLMIAPATGGEPREVFRASMNEVFTAPGIAWTPEGRYVLVVGHIGTRQPAERGLWRIPVEGGQPLKLLTMRVRYPSVHPDGRRIAFDEGSFKTEVWAMENFLPQLGASR